MWDEELMWNDTSFTWNPQDYDGVTHFKYPASKVWKPDFACQDARKTYQPAGELPEYVTIHHDGKIKMKRILNFENKCIIDMTNFPYDKPKCTALFYLYWMNYDMLRLAPEHKPTPGEPASLSRFTFNNDWFIRDYNVSLDRRWEATGLYEFLNYEIVMERNPSFYLKLILIPTLLLGALVLTIFWIPPIRADRTNLGMSVFGGFMLMLLLLVNICPPTRNINIGIYFCSNICLVVMSTVLSSMTVALSCKEIRMDSKFIKNVFVVQLGQWLNIFQQYDNVMKYSASSQTFRSGAAPNTTAAGHQAEIASHKLTDEEFGKLPVHVQNRLMARRDWQVTAVVLDRMFFLIYFIMVITLLAVYFPWPDNLDWLWI